MKRTVLVALLLLAGRTWSYQAKNVVILVIDGPRQSECWAEPRRQYIPQMAGILAPQGTLYPDFKNNGPTYTSAGHTAICTGSYEELENSVGSDLPRHPGIFQAFLKKTGQPSSSAWVITTKGKLKLLTDTRDPQWHGRYMPFSYCGADGLGNGYGEDSDTMKKVEEVLAKQHPQLLLINLKQPDSAGHTGVWADYLQGMRDSDRRAAELWDFLQADPGYRDKTALLITHDHGRHLDGVDSGFKDHGDGCAGCRAVALLALGPDFKKGAVVAHQGELIDIPPTVAKLLGFHLNGQKGRVLKGLFR